MASKETHDKTELKPTHLLVQINKAVRKTALPTKATSWTIFLPILSTMKNINTNPEEKNIISLIRITIKYINLSPDYSPETEREQYP